MKAGIVGLPNVGKSTLFNCLTNAKAQSANFPFCTIEPNIGIVNVPDKRLETLDSLVNPEKVVPATIEILDIAGLVKGASKGEGLGNQFLANIRETDAIIHVLRCFDNDKIIHVEGSIDPIRDKETIDMELQLKDLETIEKKIERIKRAIQTGEKNAIKENDVLIKIQSSIGKSKNVRELNFTKEEYAQFVKPLQLLTDKPVLYVCNVDEMSASKGNEYVNKVHNLILNENSNLIFLSVNVEAEINELESFEERKLFLDDLGIIESGGFKLIHATYDLLNRQTFFTAGKKEVKAWTVNKGDNAPKAASVIHSDFEKGFICAEVISFSNFQKYGSENKVKEAGKMKIEGKEYKVNDRDVIHFRFNV